MGGKLASGALSAPAPSKTGAGAGAATGGGMGGSVGGVVAAAGPGPRRRVGARAGVVLGRTATAFEVLDVRGFLAAEDLVASVVVRARTTWPAGVSRAGGGFGTASTGAAGGVGAVVVSGAAAAVGAGSRVATALRRAGRAGGVGAADLV